MFSTFKSISFTLIVSLGLIIWFIQKSNNDLSVAQNVEEPAKIKPSKKLKNSDALVTFNKKPIDPLTYQRNKMAIDVEAIKLPATIADVEVVPDELARMEHEASIAPTSTFSEEPVPGSPELSFDIQTIDELPAIPASVKVIPEELERLEQQASSNSTINLDNGEPFLGSPEFPYDIDFGDEQAAIPADVEVVPGES